MMLRTSFAVAITAVSLALLGVQFASMSVDSGVLPTVAPHGACGIVLGELPQRGGSETLRPGDVIDQSALDANARLFIASASVKAGTRVVLPVTRNGQSVQVALPTSPAPAWTFWLIAFLSKLIVYGVGALVLWRGRDDAAYFFGIASLAIAVAVHPEPSSVLPTDTQLSYSIAARLCADVAAFFLYLMAERLSRQALSPGWIAVARTAVVASLATDAASTVIYVRDIASGVCVGPTLATLVRVAFMVALIALLAVLAAAYVTSTGVARQRLKWIVLSTGVGFSGVLLYLSAQIVGQPIPAYPVMNITMVAIPIGYSYAILRHRVLDVGFAINRAIVFTAMTTLVVVVFALLSGVIERAAVGPGASVALQVAVALGLALSFNALQKRVESTIDRIFFSRKHRAEAELARVADEAPFINNPDTLLERVASTVRRELASSGAAIYLAEHDAGYARAATDGAAFPENVPVDDPAFVRLRTYLRDVELADIEHSALGMNGLAFPLASQGRLTGALVCAHRLSEEPYDPDERAVVRALAARVAATIEALRAREFAQLARAIADGGLNGDAARARARSLFTDLL